MIKPPLAVIIFSNNIYAKQDKDAYIRTLKIAG